MQSGGHSGRTTGSRSANGEQNFCAKILDRHFRTLWCEMQGRNLATVQVEGPHGLGTVQLKILRPTKQFQRRAGESAGHSQLELCKYKATVSSTNPHHGEGPAR